MKGNRLAARLGAAMALGAFSLFWHPIADGGGRGDPLELLLPAALAPVSGGAHWAVAGARSDRHGRVAARHLAAVAPQSPVVGLDDQRLAQLLRERPEVLGSASIGRPSRGALWGGVQLCSGEHLLVHSPRHAWGTASAVTAITRAAAEVAARFAGPAKLDVGDLSRRRGGYLRPHRSHQSGLDVDVGYYYLTRDSWYRPATAANLDRARTWAFIEALTTLADVETIFIDRRVQTLLREYAHAHRADADRVDELFVSRLRPHALIRHTWGHRTHMHVRFSDPAARTTARRVYPRLRRLGKL